MSDLLFEPIRIRDSKQEDLDYVKQLIQEGFPIDTKDEVMKTRITKL
jgi:hypothetical protein